MAVFKNDQYSKIVGSFFLKKMSGQVNIPWEN